MPAEKNADLDLYEEPTLINIPEAAAAPAPAPAKTRKPKGVVPRTPEDDSAQDIMAAWIDWYQERTGTPIPSSVIARLAKQVKELIIAGYHSNDIKYGLAAWAVDQYDNPSLSPQILDRIVWGFARAKSPAARAAMEQMKADVRNFQRGTGIAPSAQMTKKQARDRADEQSTDQWLAKKNQEGWR